MSNDNTQYSRNEIATDTGRVTASRCAKACWRFRASSSCISAARSNRFPSPGASPGPAGAPVVVAMGGISASRRVWLPDEPRGGWWHEVVGPGLALDTQRFRILSFDYLGASADSTGPRDGAPFPDACPPTTRPNCCCASSIISASRSLRAIAGASYGGMVALAFGERYPGPRRAAHRDQRRGSRASDGERLARGAAAHREVRHRDRQARRRVSSWRARWPWRLIAAPRNSRRASPAPRGAMRTTNSCCRSRSTCSRAARSTRSAIGRNRSFVCPNPSTCTASTPARIFAPVTAIAVREDQLVPLGDMRAMVARLPNAELHEISSVYGHDAFLKENRRLAPIFANVLNDNPGTSP